MFARRYQKLIKCYVDGTPVEPAEYMKGDIQVDTVEIDDNDPKGCDLPIPTNNYGITYFFPQFTYG